MSRTNRRADARVRQRALAACPLALALALAPGCPAPTLDESARAPTAPSAPGGTTTLGPDRFAVRAVVEARVGSRRSAQELDGEVRVELDQGTAEYALFRVDDPIGAVWLEVRGTDVDLLEDGVRVPLVRSGDTHGGVETIEFDDPGAHPVRRAVTLDGGCRAVELVSAWPPEDALRATERADAWTLCPDGIRARTRRTAFPAGERTLSWRRDDPPGFR